MRTIAVIEKNRCQFDKMEEFALPLLYKQHNDEERILIKNNINNYIWSVIEPYVKFIDIEEEDFITQVCENITKGFPERKPDEFFYHTEGSYSFPKKYIEFIYCQPIWKDYVESKTENMNNLACLFSLKHNIIENSCVIFVNKFDMKAAHFTAMDSITKEDIIRIVRRRFLFSAIIIKQDSMVKYYYQNPAFLISNIYGLTDQDNIEKISISHLKYNLVLYFQHDKSKYINKIATRINGCYQLHGDVLVIHEMEENVFANISIHEAKRINVLSYGKLSDRKLTEEEIHTVSAVEIDTNGKEVEKKVTPFWSRYIIINHRMNEWQNQKMKCANCHDEVLCPVICPKCFRTKYCSKKCMDEFDTYHSEDCINPKSF